MIGEKENGQFFQFRRKTEAKLIKLETFTVPKDSSDSKKKTKIFLSVPSDLFLLFEKTFQIKLKNVKEVKSDAIEWLIYTTLYIEFIK